MAIPSDPMRRRAGTLLVAALLWGCSGIVDRYTGEDTAKEVRAVGLPAEGEVLAIWDTGVRLNDDPVVGFRLEIRAAGLDPWEAETRALISILDIPQIQPGARLSVMYDPADPSRVAIVQKWR